MKNPTSYPKDKFINAFEKIRYEKNRREIMLQSLSGNKFKKKPLMVVEVIE